MQIRWQCRGSSARLPLTTLFPGCLFWWGMRRGVVGLGGGHPVLGCELLGARLRWLRCWQNGSGACKWQQRYPAINGLRLLQGYILPNQSSRISKLEAVKITSFNT